MTRERQQKKAPRRSVRGMVRSPSFRQQLPSHNLSRVLRPLTRRMVNRILGMLGGHLQLCLPLLQPPMDRLSPQPLRKFQLIPPPPPPPLLLLELLTFLLPGDLLNHRRMRAQLPLLVQKKNRNKRPRSRVHIKPKKRRKNWILPHYQGRGQKERKRQYQSRYPRRHTVLLLHIHSLRSLRFLLLPRLYRPLSQRMGTPVATINYLQDFPFLRHLITVLNNNNNNLKTLSMVQQQHIPMPSVKKAVAHLK